MAETDSYRDAPDVAKIARALIKEHHSHLRADRIIYLFTSKCPTKGGKIVLGKVGLITELESALFGDDEGVEADFYMVITGSEWVVATDAKKQAIVDHELCHLYYDLDTDKPKIAEHDIADFNEVIRRHGLWSQDAEKTARVMQPYLPGLGDVPDNVDMETGEITDAPVASAALDKAMGELQDAVPAGGSVTISAGGKSATLRGKEQKPRFKGVDGAGHPLPTSSKRGAVPTGPQAPIPGA